MDSLKKRKIQEVFSNEEVFQLKSTKMLLQSRLQTLTQQLNKLRLQSEKQLNNRNSGFIKNFQAGWLQLMKNIQNVCQPFLGQENPNLIQFTQSNTQIPKSSQQLLEDTYKFISNLLIKIQTTQRTQSDSDLSKQNAQLTNSFLLSSTQINDFSSKVNSLQGELAGRDQRIQKLKAVVEQAEREKARCEQVAFENTLAASCECVCFCGSRKNKEDAEHPEIKRLQQEVKSFQTQKEYYQGLFEQATQQKSKLQLQLEVSEERFTRTRVFKKLITDAKNMIKQIDTLNSKNQELQKSKDEQEETIKRQVKKLTQNHDTEKAVLKSEIQALQNKMNQQELQAQELNFQNTLLREEQKRGKIKQQDLTIQKLGAENNRLREQIVKLKKNHNDSEKKVDDLQNKLLELKDTLFLKESQIVVQPTQTFPQTTPIDERLSAYRKQIHELNHLLREKERKINKMDEYNRQKKQKFINEQMMKENLMIEYEFLEKAYLETMKKNQQLSAQAGELEANNIQLMKERVKQEHVRTLFNTQKQALEEKLDAKQELIISLNQLVSQHQDNKAHLGRQVSLLEEKLKALETELKLAYQAHDQNIKSKQCFQVAKKHLQDKIKNTEAICIKHTTESVQHRFMLQQAEKKVQRLEEDLLLSREVLSPYELVNAELMNYRKLFRCPLCKNRIKNCLLSTCFHSFCKRCLEHFISTRNKKCPQCYTRFNVDDIKPLNWVQLILQLF